MTDKVNTSKNQERNSKLDKYNNDRHSVNARAAADPKTNIPRINTDNL